MGLGEAAAEHYATFHMKVRVLLVDDHHEARVTLEGRLLRAPTLDLVGTAASVEEAATILRDACADIVLIDTQRQDGSGNDVCRRLQQLTDAPLVAFTSFMTPELWAATKEAGAADYLLKHIDTGRLSREILRLAQRHASQPGRAET